MKNEDETTRYNKRVQEKKKQLSEETSKWGRGVRQEGGVIVRIKKNERETENTTERDNGMKA